MSAISQNIDLSTLSRSEKLKLLELLEVKEEKQRINAAKTDLLEFAKQNYNGYSVGPHHKRMAALFRDIALGRKKRIIINIAPRHGKSELTSYLFPAWFLGQRPDAKIIMATHTASLSELFGRRVRNLISTPEYQKIFPGTSMAEDSKSMGAWNTSAGGMYYAVGVGGALAGRGADLCVIDDPHSEQDGRANSRTAFDQAWEWYQTGPRQRLQWGGAVIIVMTRWSLLDLTGRLLEHQSRNPDADQWEVVEFPAILEVADPEHPGDPASIKEKSLWPDKWKLDELQKARASMDPRYWNAQYLQQPTSDASAMIKREWWRVWKPEEPPKCEFIIQVWDTAHEAKTSADYSACQTWGIWANEEDKGLPHIILLDAFRDRMEFPELKACAYEHWDEWKPDAFIIEKKAAGAPLIQELRSMGIPVNEYSPSRGNDKIARINAITDIFASGKVWAPDTRWAKEVIEECASFPVGDHDDYVDCASAALLRFRQGRFVTLDSDWKDEPKMFRSHRASGYY